MLDENNSKTKIFISKAKKIHGEKYDYSKVEYINAKTKIIIIFKIIFKIHAEFSQTPSNHLSSYNCQKCSNNFKLSTQISNWTSPEIQIERDKYKMKCANENGFSVIRLLQIDISKDKFDWLDEIKLNILKITNEKIVQNIFICKNNEYKFIM